MAYFQVINIVSYHVLFPLSLWRYYIVSDDSSSMSPVNIVGVFMSEALQNFPLKSAHTLNLTHHN